jgi:RNA-directed DNA polymerase
MRKVLPRTPREHSRTGRITRAGRYQACTVVKRHRGAAGRDTPSIKRCAANWDEHLVARMRARKSGTDPPLPLRRGYIPKGKGAVRPLGLPTVRWRVAQEGIRAVSAPLCAPTCHDRSHGCRRQRRCHTAMTPRVEWHQPGYRVVGDADLTGCVDRLPHHLLLALGAGESADGNIVRRITQFLQAGVLEEGAVRPPGQGTPHGGGSSPLLATSVLNHLEWRVEALG